VPAGFTDVSIASVSGPTAFDFTPDGRMLVTLKGGALRVITPPSDTLLPTAALTLAPCTQSERGLLGVAVHPQFASNHFIYLFYTLNTGSSPPCVNRVSRFTLPDTNLIDPTSELVLIDNMPSPNGNHNGGDVQFGKGGALYVTIGEGGIAAVARQENVLAGKVLRITDSGGIPADNPFQGAGTARCNVSGSTVAGNRCQETFAWGFRNPFRIAFDPNGVTTRFFINDVGQTNWEEISLGQSGGDYGWNLCEGTHAVAGSGTCAAPPPNMVSPLFEYAHGATIPGTSSPTNCNAVTGGAFVPNGLWAGHDGLYLFSDFVCGGIFRLTQSGPTWTASDFGSGLGGVSHLRFGPSAGGQALYYANVIGGEIRRVTGPAAASPASKLFTVTPCRLIDTRGAAGPYGAPALAGGATRTFTLGGAATCGVPANAVAVAVNLTVTGTTAGGFLTFYPAGTSRPNASTINFSTAQTRANNAVLRLGAAGDVTVFGGMQAGATTELILDVVGYFQ
jgi:hypothetical protein